MLRSPGCPSGARCFDASFAGLLENEFSRTLFLLQSRNGWPSNVNSPLEPIAHEHT
ncbi:hypothetical protein SBA2_1100002 [Acidobacteriia bacterium SbA2]|nr:hypothetical protein SBA2_1100002 [Acidobacteriia bacterium SbA2]